MNNDNYLSSFFTSQYGQLLPSINQIKLLAKLITKLSPSKLMYHLYSNQSYIDFILIENGIEQIICIEPDADFVRSGLLSRKNLRTLNKELVTIYNHNPLSNEFNYSDANIILISFPDNLSDILSKINKECQINTLLIIESYSKPLIELKELHHLKITDLINIYIYKI
jgi:hypothetical protein